MFNALVHIQEMESAGFSRPQAEATVNMLYRFTDQNLATKQDIANLKQDILDLKLELKHSSEMLEQKMTVKMGAMLVVAVGVLTTLQKIL